MLVLYTCFRFHLRLHLNKEFCWIFFLLSVNKDLLNFYYGPNIRVSSSMGKAGEGEAMTPVHPHPRTTEHIHGRRRVHINWEQCEKVRLRQYRSEMLLKFRLWNSQTWSCKEQEGFVSRREKERMGLGDGWEHWGWRVLAAPRWGARTLLSSSLEEGRAALAITQEMRKLRRRACEGKHFYLIPRGLQAYVPSRDSAWHSSRKQMDLPVNPGSSKLG